MAVSFERIQKGGAYTRNTLAELWGYSSFLAIARGVVTPRDDNKIILFVTAEKQNSAEQYEDRLVGDTLHWEGPTDHFAEDRMVNASSLGEEVHLFYRDRHHSAFTYMGTLRVLECERREDQPSRFRMKIE